MSPYSLPHFGRGARTAVKIVYLSGALTACGTPELYSSSVWQLRYDGPETPASIQVSDPQMYPRHALINERRDEADYLDELLKGSRTVAFKPQIARDIETVRSLSLALGLSFDAGAKRTNRSAEERGDVAQQIDMEKLQGQLLQTQRDIELLKVKLAEQTTTSAAGLTPANAATASATVAPAASDTAAMITRLDASVTNLIARFDKEHSMVRQITNTDAPREQFQDRQAYRRDLQSAINSNSLDVLHDLGPNSLFRMQFRATVLPGEGSEALGVLQMEIERPQFTNESIQGGLQPLYFQWLDHVTERMNMVARGRVVLTDPALVQLGREERMFAIVSFTFPDSATPLRSAAVVESQGVTKVEPNRGMVVPPPDHVLRKIMRIDRFYSDKGGEALALERLPKGKAKAKAKAKASAKNGGVNSATATEAESPAASAPPVCTFGIETEERLKCDTVSVAFPAAFTVTLARLLEKDDAFNVSQASALTSIALSLAKRGTVEPTDAERASCAPFEGKEANSIFVYYGERPNLIRLQRAYAWVAGKFGGGDVTVERTVRDKIRRITLNLQAGQKLAEAYDDSICSQANRRRAGDIVPRAFIQALFTYQSVTHAVANSADSAGENVSPSPKSGSNVPTTASIWVARGRLATYAVSPVALAQQVSTVARAADAVQLAASLAASLPAQGVGASAGMGYMRSVTGKADTVERVPLVVGFSSAALVDVTGVSADQARFGWLLGPNVVLDTNKKALKLEHNLAPYELTADLSMPSWWPHVTIISNSAWSPNWRDKQNQIMVKAAGNKERRSKVPMRQSRSDLDSLSAYLMEGDALSAEITQVGMKMAGSQIVSIEPPQVSDCLGATTMVVTGQSLWRASSAYLSGIKASHVEVLPDMAGLSLTFDIGSLQPGVGTAMLVIPTPDGEAMKEVPVIGSRLVGKNCTVDSPDDGVPKIAATYPASVSACESRQRIVLKGGNLDEIESAYLGSIALTILKPTYPNPKVLELNVDQVIGTHGGNKATLPLIVKTFRKGIAVVDIGIDRTACDASIGAELALIEGPAGRIDVCGTAVNVMITGDRAHMIESAMLKSSLPQFDLQARSVKFSPASNVAEIAFVGIPKSKITGPDQLVSPLKLSLRSRNEEITVVDLPAVCGTYK